MSRLLDFIRGTKANEPVVGSGPVELTKRRSAVSLDKQGSAGGNLRVNLTWQMRTSDFDDRPNNRKNLLRRPLDLFNPELVQAQGPALVTVDLDLACMYELADGSKGVVQPLGDLLGNINEPPYIHLSGDDRFGSASGETMYINLDHKDAFRRLLIFVYIYDGTPAFDRARAKITLYPRSGPPIEIALQEREPQARSCSVVLIENIEGELIVRREVKYVYGFQSELDRLYGWGLQWGRAQKTSRLRR